MRGADRQGPGQLVVDVNLFDAGAEFVEDEASRLDNLDRTQFALDDLVTRGAQGLATNCAERDKAWLQPLGWSVDEQRP